MEANIQQPPKSFWIIGAAALAWNLVGVVVYLGQVTMTPETLASLPPEQQSLYVDIPAWATGANGLAVTAGTLGSVLLLLRSGWCVPVFLVSLAAVLVQMYHAFAMADLMSVMGPASALLPGLIIAIGVGLIWYARYAKESGWFR
ncbi:MAG: hypothetical protein R3315_03875 [Woeseiaceae bacterium]|nr:hypothetical protein [Woeseiaceae bacterium]